MKVRLITMGLSSGIALRFAVCCVLLLSACSSAAEPADPALTTIALDTEPQGAAAPASVDDAPETTTPPDNADAPLSGTLSITVVDTHPHDSNAFTQGLELVGDGRLLEGTGLYGESDRRLVDIETGEALEILEIDGAYFGEGITIVGGEIIQLTWKSGLYFRADLETLVETGRGSYDGEGWGLCFDGNQLAMSNGSSTLTFRDPETFDATRTVQVMLDGEPVERLNELECVNGQVLANVWLTDLIIVIDPANGEVVATLDGSVLRPPELPFDDSSFALNGIAHDPDTGHYYLTGKRWPVVYEVELS